MLVNMLKISNIFPYSSYFFSFILLPCHFVKISCFIFKGAVENILERSSFLQLADGNVVPLDDESRLVLLHKMQNMTSQALRCLGLAFKEDLKEFKDYDGENHAAHILLQEPANYGNIEKDLIFVGLLGLRVSFDVLEAT